jgi:hypothetical protein
MGCTIVKEETIGMDEIEIEEHTELEPHNNNFLYLFKHFYLFQVYMKSFILNFIYFKFSYLFYIYYKSLTTINLVFVIFFLVL